MTSFQRIPLDKIEPDPNNPRRHIDEQKLNEMATSIMAHGVVTPITVRPAPRPNGVLYRIAFGERRWRGSQIAGVTDIPAIVDDTLTDVQVLERQLVENSQREGVSPLDEASAYRSLLDEHGFTMDDLVAKVGRSRSHLYSRIKLLDLVKPARDALIAGKLSVACAEMIARLDAKVQTECLKDALGQREFGDYEDVNVIPEGIGAEGESFVGNDDHQPLSFRGLQALIHRKFTLRLETAPFPTYDAALVPEAGQCGDCPHRTGNQPDLFPDLKKPADSCTKPTCFEAKVNAHWLRTKEHHEALGHKVVTGKDAKALFGFDGKPTGHGEYVAPDQELPTDLARPGSKATWGKLLGKAIDQVPRVVVQDERGAAHEMLDKKAATKLLRDAGKLDEATKPDKAGKEQRAKERGKRELREEAFKRVLVAVSQGAADVELAGKKGLAVLRWLAHGILDNCKYGAESAVESLFTTKTDGERPSDVVANAIDEAKTSGAVLAIAAALLVGGCADAVVGEWKGQEETEACFEGALKLFGADWDKALEAAKVAAKAESKAGAAKAKKGKSK